MNEKKITIIMFDMKRFHYIFVCRTFPARLQWGGRKLYLDETGFGSLTYVNKAHDEWTKVGFFGLFFYIYSRKSNVLANKKIKRGREIV